MTDGYELLNQERLLEEIIPSNTNMDNENNDNLRTKNDIDFLASASMTESYSEIMNSPSADRNDGSGIESNPPIVIAKRKPNSLSRNHSNQCKQIFKISIKLRSTSIFLYETFSIFPTWIDPGG